MDERTSLAPCTPYGINKAASLWMARAYRDRHNVFVSNAILFNHESPRRPEHFVTRKISKRVAEIKLGMAEKLELGNLQVRRDWGYAGDFVNGMWKMLQAARADDFVLGTGETHSLEQFVSLAFAYAGLDCEQHVTSVQHLVRAGDTLGCAADNSKARSVLNWEPKVGFEALVEMMVESDIAELKQKSVTPSRSAA